MYTLIRKNNRGNLLSQSGVTFEGIAMLVTKRLPLNQDAIAPIMDMKPGEIVYLVENASSVTQIPNMQFGFHLPDFIIVKEA